MALCLYIYHLLSMYIFDNHDPQTLGVGLLIWLPTFKPVTFHATTTYRCVNQRTQKPDNDCLMGWATLQITITCNKISMGKNLVVPNKNTQSSVVYFDRPANGCSSHCSLVEIIVLGSFPCFPVFFRHKQKKN